MATTPSAPSRKDADMDAIFKQARADGVDIAATVPGVVECRIPCAMGVRGAREACAELVQAARPTWNATRVAMAVPFAM